MLIKCKNCNLKYPFGSLYKQFFSKNRYIGTCPKCGTVYKATTFSKIITLLIFVIPFTHFIEEKKLLLYIIWILIFSIVLQPIILQFKEKNND